MDRYICIHGHFYQPPRENPWLEEIESQDSAYPFHDWNERVTAECYAPNAAARILDSQKKIADIVNNYSKISFNFGPTLLSWMENHAPHVYEAILEADRISQKKFSGHGAAIAQAYNHVIMPLANSRDKETQVVWGIKDFEYRFKRKPEGMWLPETAVDLETLGILAARNIKFTILSPTQAARVRKLDEATWQDTTGGRIDPQIPYLCRLPSGKSIVLFFFNGPISQEVAFAGLLNNGENFARRLIDSFPREESKETFLCHIATDGETYGHHHRFGDMALAYCLEYIQSKNLAKITVYGEFLEKFPPTQEVEILENTSWSCIHGIERWRANCGCHLGVHAHWTQEWRLYLRQSLDWLRDELINSFQKEILRYLKKSWEARDHYIDVILQRSEERLEKFLEGFAKSKLTSEEMVKVIKLLEIQRQAMLMYTSCGWFFDEISGIETIQVMQYAARAIQLMKETNGMDLEKDFLDRLKLALSNVVELKDGARVYERFVAPSIIDLFSVGVHYALSSLFQDYLRQTKIYSYEVEREMYEHKELGSKKLAIGRIKIYSSVTGEEIAMSFAVLHQGEHNLNCGATADLSADLFKRMKEEIWGAFGDENFSAVWNLMDKHFGTHQYSLWDIFKSAQEKILNEILDPTLKGLDRLFRQIYQQNYPLIHAKKDKRISLPKTLATMVEFILHRDLQKFLEDEPLNLEQLQKLIKEVRRRSFELDKGTLSHIASAKVNHLMQNFFANPQETSLMITVDATLRVLDKLPLNLNLWKSENLYFFIKKKFYPMMQEKTKQGDPKAKAWVKVFEDLGKYL